VPQDKVATGEIKLEGCSVEYANFEKYKRKYCLEVHTTSKVARTPQPYARR
jgi:hypothetical protein